ncbi:MAG: VCBS repeat-containing protein [Candidatus Thermoplasmatota archaeon]|nr:VCBS repeat-containing protein [Candidatus Thermoplasmatota archaeon]
MDENLLHRGVSVGLCFMMLLSVTPCLITPCSEVSAEEYHPEGTVLSPSPITLISKSTGLDVPAKEGGDTELELADINNDGHLDIICVGDHGSPYINSDQHGIMVWLNNGQGVWSVSQVGNFGYGGIEAGDLNLDGFLDVVWGIHHDYGVPGFGDTLIGAALGDGTATNWIPWATGLGTGGEDWGMAATDLADFDCNGVLDLISQSFGCCNGYHLYENHGNGTWTHVWSLTGGNANDNLEVGDFNADGYPDFVGTREATHVFLGDGSFGFLMPQNGLPTATWYGADCGDINNDGTDDLVVGGNGFGVRCYRFESSNNTWVSLSTGLPTTGSYYPQLGDLDGDGNLDVVAYLGPGGTVYLGDGTGSWVADATFTMVAPGGYSAFVVDGDFDHDGREDIVIQAEQGSWPSYQNVLRAFSPWLEPTALTAQVTSPHGGETLRAGSIRIIRWLAAVPPTALPGNVDIQLSLHGEAGPWMTIAQDVPNSGWYQWLVDGSGSSHCRIKITVTAGSSTVSAVSPNDFTILGFSVNAHGPYQGAVGEPVQFTGSAENGTPPYEFLWEFGEGNSSTDQNPVHVYQQQGNYTVVLTVTDSMGITVQDATWALIIGDNTPPDPPVIDGPAVGRINVVYNYTLRCDDPELDDVFFRVDWGDGNMSEWVGPVASGEEIIVSHEWLQRGVFTIKAQAKDAYGLESDWAMLRVWMPTKSAWRPPGLRMLLEQFITWWLEATPLLRLLSTL